MEIEYMREILRECGISEEIVKSSKLSPLWKEVLRYNNFTDEELEKLFYQYVQEHIKYSKKNWEEILNGILSYPEKRISAYVDWGSEVKDFPLFNKLQFLYKVYHNEFLFRQPKYWKENFDTITSFYSYLPTKGRESFTEWLTKESKKYYSHGDTIFSLIKGLK